VAHIELYIVVLYAVQKMLRTNGHTQVYINNNELQTTHFIYKLQCP